MTLKIKPEDLEVLRLAVTPFDTEELRAKYRNGDFPRSELTRDLDKRYRWDLMWMTRLKLGDGVGVKGDLDLYAYLNDLHIDSALRFLVKPLGEAACVAA
jgi:hypothetical protein